MKKFIILTTALLIFLPSKSFAVDLTNNYKGYVIENHKYKEVEEKITKTQVLKNSTPIPNIPHAYYETTDKNNHCYIRFYPANNDTNIYIVSEKSIPENNELTKTLDNLKYSYTKLNDKAALREYKFDFIDLARSGAFDSFFIIPDYLKPLKTGTKKVNSFISKKTKKKALKKYSEDEKEIKLTLLETQEKSENNIKIISNEYRFKGKENKYVHAFEYIIENIGAGDIELKSINSDSIASLRDVETTALSDLDKFNVLDTLGTTLALFTAGATIGLKVPNYIRLIKMTTEAKRYGKELPQNRIITQNSSLRILLMKFKLNQTPLIFTFEKNGKEFEFEI